MLIKKLLFLFLLSLSANSFAENIIYKCTDSNGSVTYTNKKEKQKCTKTNLATIDKGTVVNKNNTPNDKDDIPSELIVPGITTPKTPPSKLPNDFKIDPEVQVINKEQANENMKGK
jgi:Domain of unknown function (DUF4124)